MGKKLDKFLLLMWKNWILLKRRPIHSLFEIVYPACMIVLLLLVKSLLTATQEEQRIYHSFDASDTLSSAFFTDSVIAYSPPGFGFILRDALDVYNGLEFRQFDNSMALDNAIDNHNITNLAVAVHVDDTFQAGITKNLNVVIRMLSEDSDAKLSSWYSQYIFPVFQLPGPREPDSDVSGEPYYAERGFLYLQQVLTLKLLRSFPQPNPLPSIRLQRFPNAGWLNDLFYSNNMSAMVSLMIMISFMYNFINTVRAITSEKEMQLKESMKIMGLPGWLHWLAWFLRTLILLVLAVVIETILLTVHFGDTVVFNKSDGTLIFVLLLVTSCSFITFAFLVSVFFSKANTAAAVGSLVFFLTYLPYSLIQQQAESASAGTAYGCSFLTNSGLAFALTQVLNELSPDDTTTLGGILLILIADIFIYLVIALYIEQVFPGEFGVPQPWYFPFMKAYWCNQTLSASELELGGGKANVGSNFEEFTEPLPKGIQLKNLYKIFGANTAVNGLNLDMYEGHITALLGHNGAGKTTTMSMITGMFPPSQGTALVAGYDVRTSISKVRDSMGLCLQHNVLFDNLTVAEHLYFFGRLKGLSKSEVKYEINNYLKLLEFEDKKNAPSRTLSGGMKRKLSVGMALCGKSKIVLLDEPTAGMDPSARRAIWNVLQKQKEGRTILLTTHFMDEADLLGDRIAIMSGGELQCVGSSFFLKRRYGAGYSLVMDVLPNAKINQITAVFQKNIPHVKIFSHVGSELTYQLPENESSKFETMLHELEQKSAHLGIQSYGVSLTTLETVFMKVGADHDNKLTGTHVDKNTEITVEQDLPNNYKLKYLEGTALVTNQAKAMFLKKFFAYLRTWNLLLYQIFVPIILLIISILSTDSSVQSSTFPARNLTLDAYTDPVTVVQGSLDPYDTIFKNIIGTVDPVDNITATLLQESKEYPSLVKSRYILGASFEGTVVNGTLTAWFNGDPYHALPLSLGVMLNTLFKSIVGTEASITFTNAPLPLSAAAQLQQLQFNVVAFQIASQLAFSMAIVASFYVLFCIKERVSKSKHLQFVSGVNVVIFWGVSYLVDFITYLLVMCGLLITFCALQEEGYRSADELGRLTLIFLYFGCNILPFVYLLCYMFTVPSSGFSRTALLGTLTGIVSIVVMQVLEIDDLGLLYIARPLDWVLLFIPFYSVAKGINNLGSIYTLRKTCSLISADFSQACAVATMCCDIDNYYALKSPGIGRNILISFIMSGVLFCVLLFNEYGFVSMLISRIINYNKPPLKDTNLDEDVRAENEKIRKAAALGYTTEYALVLKDVTKYYKNFLAVNGICLGVKPYECFGLLGVNGAGKTTTFKMMTGDEQISYGDAWVNNCNIQTEQKKVQKLIGYCPQFDALLDDLTARETLKIFALIRGVPMEECYSLGANLAREFDFYKHLDKQVKQLSGGNKRKLSTALALIGDPPVIYLDEPTTGMDPATKRYLWNAINKLRDNGKCIVLTSHSMEECEALCTRIAIMVNGTFQCLGSSQRLKNKFAQGFSLTIKIERTEDPEGREREIAEIDRFVKESFPGAELKEKYQELLSYQLVDNAIPWSRMFGILEKSKRRLHIDDYSLGQCSLEQVFLSFTKYQQ